MKVQEEAGEQGDKTSALQPRIIASCQTFTFSSPTCLLFDLAVVLFPHFSLDVHPHPLSVLLSCYTNFTSSMSDWFVG